jgi:hypothetical protein
MKYTASNKVKMGLEFGPVNLHRTQWSPQAPVERTLMALDWLAITIGPGGVFAYAVQFLIFVGHGAWETINTMLDMIKHW